LQLQTLEEKLDAMMSKYDALQEQAVRILLNSLPDSQRAMV